MNLFPFGVGQISISGFTICTHPSENDALQTYSSEPAIQAEFPGAETLLGDYEDAVPPFATVWADFVEMITRHGNTLNFSSFQMLLGAQSFSEHNR